MAYEQGTPDRIPPDQPDPVIVGPGLSALGEGAYKKASTATPTVVSDERTDEPVTNNEAGASYFADVPGTATTTKDAYVKSPTSPADVISGPTSGAELLRRLSLVGGAGLAPVFPLTDPRAAHAGLQLTGRIISAAFCIPYKVAYQPGSDWVRSYPSDGLPWG
jgi:trehalose 6-phosphate synthase/phosphatase